MLQAALEYARLGWAVFPVHSVAGGKCSCNTAGCQNPGKHPCTRNGVHDATTDLSKINGWWRQRPDANIGIATGAASGIFVLDVDPRHDGENSLFALEQNHGRLVAAVECLTGGGGRHLYFKYPRKGGIRNRTGNPGPGLDVRGDGGYVLAPPSSHISGAAYTWEASSQPASNAILDAPAWLLEMLVLPDRLPYQAPAHAQPAQVVKTGGRNTFLTRKAGQLRRSGLSMEEMEPALLKLNQTRCQPPLADDEVRKIARSISRYDAPHQPTDDELVDSWLSQHPETVYGMGEFRRYKDGCWPIVQKAQIERELKNISVLAKRDGYKPTYHKLCSVYELARIEVNVPIEKWNADRDLLVCRNGTLHIPSMTLGPHDKNHWITSGVAYDYDPQAAAPRWEQFCQKILRDAEVFLQEFAGYALTTDTGLETAIWLYGPPGSGKSTFITGLTTILGSRAGILGLADLEKSRFSLTDLPDKTLLVSTEQPSLFVQATEKVNALISGEPMLVDRKYRDPVTVQSFAKVCWAMNELPRVSEASNGLFRRVKVIEFADLPEQARDPNFKQYIKAEGAGLLNWALAGLSRLRQNGLFTIPPRVLQASAEFKRINDIPSVFLEEKCEIGPGFSVSGAALYAAYRQWCIDNGHKIQSSTSLAMDWRRLGFLSQHIRTGTLWSGLRLKGL